MMKRKKEGFTYNQEMIIRHFNQMQEMYLYEHFPKGKEVNTYSIKEDDLNGENEEGQLSGDINYINNNLSGAFTNFGKENNQ